MTALALVFVVHVVGGIMLVWALLDAEQRAGWRRRWGRGGHDGPPPPQPPGSSGGRAPAEPPPAPLPLPVTRGSSVRLREPERVADGYPRPARRPAHEPKPQRAPVPARQRQRRG
jgi:hypothetical protein